MKVKNISKRSFCHAELDKDYKLQMLILKPNEIKDVPDKVAQSWLKSGQVIEFVEPKEAKKLADENEALKEEIKQLKQKESSKKQTNKKRTSK